MNLHYIKVIFKIRFFFYILFFRITIRKYGVGSFFLNNFLSYETIFFNKGQFAQQKRQKHKDFLKKIKISKLSILR